MNEIENENNQIKNIRNKKIDLLVILLTKIFYLIEFLKDNSKKLKEIKNYVHSEHKRIPVKMIDLHRVDIKDEMMKKYVILNMFMVMIVLNLSFSLFETLMLVLCYFLGIFNDIWLTLPCSRRSASRFLDSVTVYYNKQVRDAVMNAQFLSFSYDGVTEKIGKKKLMALIVDCVSAEGVVLKLLLDINEVSGGALNMNNYIYAVLKCYGIEFDDIKPKSSVFVLMEPAMQDVLEILSQRRYFVSVSIVFVIKCNFVSDQHHMKSNFFKMFFN